MLKEKLTIVQNELKAPKNQYNNFGKYHYRNCEDILEALKPLLKKHKLLLTITDEIQMIGERYYVKATAILHDSEDAEGKPIINTAFARESDTQKGMDSSQLTGATSSYARKYALNGLFLIDDTKDVDSNEYQEEKNKISKASKKSEEKPKEEIVEEVDRDLLLNGTGMTESRIKKLKAEMERTGKNLPTILATAKSKSLETITEENYIAIMNLLARTKDKPKDNA